MANIVICSINLSMGEKCEVGCEVSNELEEGDLWIELKT